MDQIAITASKREVLGKEVKKLRYAGKLPAVLYGHNVENQKIEISERDFAKVFKQAGESTLVSLIVEGKAHPVLIHEVQNHYLTDRPIHVDFYAINMAEKIMVKIPLRFLGEAPAVKALGGTLVKNLSELEVECLPADLPHAIEVDISILNTFEDAVRVSKLKRKRGLGDEPDRALRLRPAIGLPDQRELRGWPTHGVARWQTDCLRFKPRRRQPNLRDERRWQRRDSPDESRWQ